MNFKDFIFSYKTLEKELTENSIYANATERADLLKDKEKVADAFVFNFIGILGIMNGHTHARDDAMLRKYFMNDKKVRLDSIGDDNNDMSLVVKLAHESGFFKNDTVTNQITRFLAKLRLGQINRVDSAIVSEWVNGLKPEFLRYIRDPQIRSAVADFAKDGGKTIDVSSIAVLLKRKMKKTEMSGEFAPFAKRFKLEARPPQKVASTADGSTDGDSAPQVQPAADGIVPQKRTRKTKDAAATPVPAPVIPVPEPKKELSIKLEPNVLFGNGFFTPDVDNYYRNLQIKYKSLKDDDIKILKEVREAIKPIVEKIFKLEISSVKSGFDEIGKIIEEAKVINVPATGDLVGSYIYRDSYDLNRYFRKEYLTGLIENIFSVEKNGTTSSNALLDRSNTKNRVNIINDLQLSNLNEKDKVIDILISGLSVVKALEVYTYGSYEDFNSNSEPFNVTIMYLFKVFKDKLSLGDVDKIISASSSTYRAVNNLANIIDISDKLPKVTILGMNIRDVIYDHIGDITSYDLSTNLVSAMAENYLEDKLRIYNVAFKYLSNKYGDDLIANGYKNSLLNKDGIFRSIYSRKKPLELFLEDLGYTLDQMIDKFPDDDEFLSIKVESQGIDSISDEKLKKYVTGKVLRETKISNSGFLSRSGIDSDEDIKKSKVYARSYINECKSLFRRSSSPEKIAKLLIEEMDSNPQNYDEPYNFNTIMHLLPKMDKSEIIALIKVAEKNKFKSFFSPDIYKDTSRRAEKEEFVSIFTGIMNDSIGTEVEDYISDILEEMPGGVIGKIRQNLVGINSLVEEVNKGTIKPFGTIDDKRLKVMLSMNDINFAAILTADIGRKKKNEKWSEYFKRAKSDAGKGGKSALGKERVTEYQGDYKQLTKIYNNSFRSGRHGDTFAKITKTFNSDIEYPEFQEFRKTNFGDGTITPAFHGTGGIAATMILRYGFKVIKSTDPSVVGRMLGDGIYFSNKLDKALQYIGNSGYGRDYGTKGYIFEMDNTLGNLDTTRGNGPDYRVMGLGGDNIRSPEWCVRDPKKQLAVRKVYEVELSSKNHIDRYLAESEESMLGFRSYLQERKLMNMKSNVTSFIFRDGQIPIFVEVSEGKYEVEFLDFEDALSQKLIPAEFIDYSMQGPVVVFDGVDQNKTFDIRFADAMNGEEFKLYEQFFMEKVLKL